MDIQELRDCIMRWEDCEARGVFPKGRVKELKKQLWNTLNQPPSQLYFNFEDVEIRDVVNYSFHDFGSSHTFSYRDHFVDFMAKQGYEYECDQDNHPKFKGVVGPMLDGEAVRYETWEMHEFLSSP